MSFKNIYFFEIPVYRLSYQHYQSENDKLKIQYLEIFRKRKISESSMNETSEFYDEIIFHPMWEFNERIGYLKLYFLGSQIRAEYFAVKAKKIYRSSRKIFEYKTHKLSPELTIALKMSNEDIFHCIVQYLCNCQKELKKRYIDIALFLQIGQFVDWKMLLKKQDEIN